MCRRSLDQIEEATWLVIEPIQHDVLDPQPRQPHHLPHRRRCERGIHDHRKRRIQSDHLLQRRFPASVVHRRVHHQQLRVRRTEQGTQLRRVRRRAQGVRVPEHEPQMREKVAWEQCYDVQFKTRVKMCRENRVFCHKMPVYATYRDPTFEAMVRREPFPPRTGVAHVPPPADPRCPYACLHGCHRLRHFSDRPEERRADRRRRLVRLSRTSGRGLSRARELPHLPKLLGDPLDVARNLERC